MHFRPSRIGALVAAGLALTGGLLAACGGSSISPAPTSTGSTTSASTATTSVTATSSSASALQLDPTHNYGNKYANGLLPVGDGRYQTSGPKVGYVYACASYASSLTGGGAFARGPWFTNNNTEYNVSQKISVQGSVSGQPSFTKSVSGGTRTIRTNDLPSHPTGTFPIASSDPAYQYDRNPNRISAQSFTFDLPAAPTYGPAQCMGGQVGVMLDGVVLYNAFDAGGRDAGAWEIQDSCDGHPQPSGAYHYHTFSSCITDRSVYDVIGFALDGTPITGPQLGAGNVLTTSDLDVCHGISGRITLDGKSVTTYHYVMTEDFPYSVSCFRATPASGA